MGAWDFTAFVPDDGCERGQADSQLASAAFFESPQPGSTDDAPIDFVEFAEAEPEGSEGDEAEDEAATTLQPARLAAHVCAVRGVAGRCVPYLPGHHCVRSSDFLAREDRPPKA
jgi:hypothetical protein